MSITGGKFSLTTSAYIFYPELSSLSLDHSHWSPDYAQDYERYILVLL